MSEESAALDPENLFWKQIAEEPRNPLPRLLYADWCDENDRPVMSLVQRWLAATGRIPMRWAAEVWCWGSEESPPKSGIGKAQTLPQPLYRELDRNTDADSGASAELARYRTQRESEEALVAAWLKASEPRWWRYAWTPEFIPMEGVIPRDATRLVYD